MAILILSPPDDDHARHMRDYLETREQPIWFLNSADFPANLQVTYDPVTERGQFRFPGGTVVDFAEVTAVYWRSYAGVSPPELPHEEQADIAGNDARGLFESLLIRLKTRWVNGWDAFHLHQTKPAALAMVAELGVPVPATVLTNDPDGLIAFIDRHTRCIFKPVQGGAHTRRLELRHLADENLDNLRYSPVTLQEEIEGTDVRVFVAGDRVLACDVRTSELDFRDDPNPEITPIELPDDVAERSVRIARKLHLLWTGIDYRRTPDGRYVFLEANPSPMFLGFEQRSGLPLTEALGDLLRGSE
jgi:glutathione synthase/RimK-type ligase-like ATP-grasp enzyme